MASLLSVFSAGRVSVLFCRCLLLTLPVIMSFPVDSSSHVSLCASLFLHSSPLPPVWEKALSSHHTLLICGWILPLGRRVKRIMGQNEIKENSVRVWPAIMTVSMLNASFSEAGAVSWSVHWLLLLTVCKAHSIPHRQNVSFFHYFSQPCPHNLWFDCMSAGLSAIISSLCGISFRF